MTPAIEKELLYRVLVFRTGRRRPLRVVATRLPLHFARQIARGFNAAERATPAGLRARVTRMSPVST